MLKKENYNFYVRIFIGIMVVFGILLFFQDLFGNNDAGKQDPLDSLKQVSTKMEIWGDILTGKLGKFSSLAVAVAGIVLWVINIRFIGKLCMIIGLLSFVFLYLVY